MDYEIFAHATENKIVANESSNKSFGIVKKSEQFISRHMG